MLMGHAEGLSKLEPAKDLLLSDPVSDVDGDEEADIPSHILYTASFKELASKNILCDTIIWVSISLVLVLAWGIGIIMLLYLPFRRCVIKKDIASRKLYVTSTEIVYKVSRPSFIPFCGESKIEKHVPLSLVIDVIVEQGFLQSMYEYTCDKAAPVDELQVQGVYNPAFLRKTMGSPLHSSVEHRGILPSELMLHRLEELNKSVKVSSLSIPIK
ncbi:Hypothetical predicted protein [Olea europaea subsp. europaea]|uniref:DUF7642 domain-containing protein n=1 Tax=Olea europaea subsp. europaea TaxID=158383 RepID=A0A8S0TAE8_OLEEU|nr:Hypothetical predicted protein [Olea europaea subsp. europaea]